LLDPSWLTAKLAATGNMAALVADYDHYAREEEQNLIGRTLRLTAGPLRGGPRAVRAARRAPRVGLLGLHYPAMGFGRTRRTFTPRSRRPDHVLDCPAPRLRRRRRPTWAIALVGGGGLSASTHGGECRVAKSLPLAHPKAIRGLRGEDAYLRRLIRGGSRTSGGKGGASERDSYQSGSTLKPPTPGTASASTRRSRSR
jgi:hypothetical protein